MDCSPPGSPVRGIFQAGILDSPGDLPDQRLNPESPAWQVDSFFPLVMYGCESWTVKKAECQRIDAFELWCWRRLMRVLWIAKRHFDFSLSCIGEGNGNPLQCSCLENPRDRGAWWAATSGVAQSWTRLKRHGGGGGRRLVGFVVS